MALLIKTDGTTQTIGPINGKNFSLDEVRDLIGGYMETYRLRDGYFFVCNEDGKRLELPVNSVATVLFNKNYVRPILDIVVGNVLIASLLELEGELENEHQ
jgi:hypothetical protein